MSKKKRETDFLYEVGTDGKKYYVKQRFESVKAGSTQLPEITNEPKCTLYLSMLKSDAWLNLTGGAVRLYHYMKMQAYSNSKNKDWRPGQGEKLHGTQFYFNKAMIKKAYPGLYPSMKQFYKDLNCLIENGFITRVSKGTFTDKAIYDLSWDWQLVKRKKRDMTKQNEARRKKQEQAASEEKQNPIPINETTQKVNGYIIYETRTGVVKETTKPPKMNILA